MNRGRGGKARGRDYEAEDEAPKGAVETARVEEKTERAEAEMTRRTTGSLGMIISSKKGGAEAADQVTDSP